MRSGLGSKFSVDPEVCVFLQMCAHCNQQGMDVVVSARGKDLIQALRGAEINVRYFLSVCDYVRGARVQVCR